MTDDARHPVAQSIYFEGNYIFYDFIFRNGGLINEKNFVLAITP